MSESLEIVVRVIAALNEAEIAHMLVGAFSRNYYAFPRSTQDMDVTLAFDPQRLKTMLAALRDDFTLDPQVSFETNTGAHRDTILHTQTGFQIELFHLSADPHDQTRFARRRAVSFEGQATAIPTPEDVIITKLRWARGKDLEDVRDVIAVQSEAALDWPYLHRWAALHGTCARLEAIRASIPPLD